MAEPIQTIHTILAQFREEVSSNRDIGGRFERLFVETLAPHANSRIYDPCRSSGECSSSGKKLPVFAMESVASTRTTV